MNFGGANLTTQKFLNEYECSGPRPPVPGQESHHLTTKMTEGCHTGAGVAAAGAASSSDCSRTSPPPYFKWHQSLATLLEDPEGVDLFNRYVKSEGSEHSERLNFYFACEGLKQKTEYEEIRKTVEAIYRFLRKSRLPLSNDLRRTIKAGLRNEINLNPHVYDHMQQDVIRIIADTTYPSFLQSELYIQYVAHAQSIAAENAAVAIHHTLTSTNVAGGGAVGGGAVGGGSTSSSSGSGSANERLPRSSTLPTLHEDTELSITDDMSPLPLCESHTPNEMPMRLTKDLLLATQRRRLDIRPPGAHGYSVYNASYSSSYNPVSRQDSERQSCSSGGKTDSDTLSISSSRDGRPHIQRRQNNVETKAMKQNALINKEQNTFAVIPRTQRMATNENYALKTDELLSKAIPILEEFKREQELNEKLRRRLQEDMTSSLEIVGGTGSSSNNNSNRQTSLSGSACGSQSYRHQGQALTEAILKKLPSVDDSDQSILDDHVSRVWSDLTPHRSPGTISPCPVISSRNRRAHDSGISGDSGSSIGGQSIRHSKSMPEQHIQSATATSSRRLTNKWPSMNTDSGISLFSADTLKSRDNTNSSRSRSMGIDAASTSTSFQLEEARRRLEDESRRSRRYSQQPPVPPQSTITSSQAQQMPPIPSQQHSTLLTTSRTTHDSTIAVYTFCDEDLPYRSKLPGTQPTLKQFKDYLPKKGSFRFFFKTACEDPDNPIIQEEIVNDAEILPLFEGKVMGLVKPYE